MDLVGLGANWGFGGALIAVCVWMNWTEYICGYSDRSAEECRQGRLLNGFEYGSGALMMLTG